MPNPILDTPLQEYGYVKGRYIRNIGDGTDSDRFPDPVAVSELKIIFTPKEAVKRIGSMQVIAIGESIECGVNDQGWLIDAQGNVGVWLVAGTYTVSYSLSQLAPHDILVSTAHTEVAPLNLPSAVPAGAPVTTTQYAELQSQIAALSGPSNSLPIRGTGFPEGVVSAPVGSEYIDTNATNGAIKWIKISGSGSTGWRVSYGDTGWRNIVVEGTLTVSGLRVRRANGTVTAAVYGQSATVGDITLWTLPAGWRTASPDIAGFGFEYPRAFAARQSQNSVRAVLRLASDPERLIAGVVQTGADWVAELSWQTSGLWPTTLPGTPV